MIRLLFALFTVVSAIAVVSSAFLQFSFLFAGRGFHFDHLPNGSFYWIYGAVADK
ncbi:hypothetical protein [Vibrio parahaemolyticus]|uniref:hypothetical protein n=1 Tax=Vibrio parahaemolyticus TaxID=670 RepID=UPI000AFCA0C6|nr:hypothetical protein [Vibrio parahaemolyticus]